MKVKLIAIALLAAVGITIGVVRSSSTVQKKSPPANGRIKWYANEAKSEGKRRVVFVSEYLHEYPGSAGTISAEEAFWHSTVVVAHVISQESSYRNNQITTWNKFLIDEVLSDAKELPWPGWQPSTLPSTLLPLQSGEFLIGKSGGIVNIDGVEVEEVDEFYPAYDLNQKYVLLIHLYPSGAARTFGGPVGDFRVQQNDKLAGVAETRHRDHKVRRDFKELYGNSLENLRKHLKEK
jgi:hypothetical protein